MKVITETCRRHYIWYYFSLQNLWVYYCKRSSERDHLQNLNIFIRDISEKKEAIKDPISIRLVFENRLV